MDFKLRYAGVICTLLLPGILLAKRIDDSPMTPFKSSITPLQPDTIKLIRQYTWKPGCPVPLTELVEVNLSYWGFDKIAHQGKLIVNQAVAQDLVSIFHALYRHKFPIQQIAPIESYQGDDNASMAANNTSAFSCRPVINRPGIFSQHSYGRAIDINPLINPYVKGNQVTPAAGKAFVDRTVKHRGKITKQSIVYNEFIKHGWDWGGLWRDVQDYQHFEKRANNQKRNINGY